MGKVVTVMNMKGGVGKTTLAMHIAGAAARYTLGTPGQRRVLAIDYDPQFNMSQSLLPAKRYAELEKSRKHTLAILLDDDTDLDPFELQVPGNFNPPSVANLATRVYGTNPKLSYLDLVPSTLDLMYVALGQANTKAAPIEERFAKFIAECRKKYDLIVIDCHPAGSLFTQTSLRASDHVLIPVAPERYSLRGVGLMMNFISSKNIGNNPPTPHIVFNLGPRFQQSSTEKAIRANPRYAKYCFNATLKKYKAFGDPVGGTGFVWASGKPYSSEALQNLFEVTKELLGKL